MSYILDLLNDKPQACFTIDSAFTDRSLRQTAGSMTSGSLTTTVGTARGREKAGVFDKNNRGKISISPFVVGREASSFSLEVTVTPTDLLSGTATSHGVQQVLSNASQYDGIVINGTVVSFITKYATTGESVCSYDFEFYQRLHIVAVHTQQTNMLYVNGVLVDTSNLTAEQQLDTYHTADGSLYIGNTLSSQRLAISTIATYQFGLNPTQIEKHYQSSRYNRTIPSVNAIFGINSAHIASTDYNRYFDIEYTPQTGFPAEGNANANNGYLALQTIDSLPVDSYATFSYRLNDAENTSIYCVMVDVQGQQYKIEVSLDEVTWTEMENNTRVPIISPGFNPSGETLFVRISFSAADPDPFVTNVRVRGYRSNVSLAEGVTIATGKTLTLTSMNIGFPTDTLNFGDTAGVYGDGTYVLSADTDSTTVVGTEVFWVKRLDANAVTWDSGTTYINGVASALSNLPVGLWAQVHIVKASATNAPVSVDGNVILLSAGTSENRLTAAEVLAHHKNQLSSDTLVVDCPSFIGFSNSNSPVTFITQAWAIANAG